MGGVDLLPDFGTLNISNRSESLHRSNLCDLFDGSDHDYFGENLFDESDHDFFGEDDGQADYTACSADDCGYCGKCSY